MRPPAELAANLIETPERHKKRSTQIKRVAGGIRSEINEATRHGLSQQEAQLLGKAAALLEKLAGNYAQASKLAQARINEEVRLAKACLAAMATTFGALSSIEDKVALIAAVNSYLLKEGALDSKRYLDMYFGRSIESLSDILAKQAPDRPIADVVSEAWQKFTKARPGYIAKYQTEIGRLQTETV